MQQEHLIMTAEDADIIFQMAEVCWSEETGPDYDALLQKIGALFPDLLVQYDYFIAHAQNTRRNLEYYCGTAQEAVARLMFAGKQIGNRTYCGTECPVCRWDSERFQEQWMDVKEPRDPTITSLLASAGITQKDIDDAIQKSIGVIVLGLHVYDSRYAPYPDMPGGSGWICVQCQQCYSFFLLDVSS